MTVRNNLLLAPSLIVGVLLLSACAAESRGSGSVASERTIADQCADLNTAAEKSATAMRNLDLTDLDAASVLAGRALSHVAEIEAVDIPDTELSGARDSLAISMRDALTRISVGDFGAETQGSLVDVETDVIEIGRICGW